MVPELNFTGSYSIKAYNFRDFELSTVRVIREGNSVGGTPVVVEKTHVQFYSTSMRSLGFDHGGIKINLSNFRYHFHPVFTLTKDVHLGDSSICPELTGAWLRVELNFEKNTDKSICLILLGERRSVVLIDRNGEIIKITIMYNS